MSAGGYESVAGFVLLAVVAMFFCYLLPTAIRSRQMAADSRMDDRFSQELRVLTRNTHPTGETQTTARGYVHAPRPDRPEVSMDRQAERPAREPRSADEARGAASVRATRAAAASRRAAAARRRLALTLLLLASSIVLWTLFVTIALPIAAPIAVTVVLAAVVVLGRRAAVRAAIADRRMVAEQAREESRGPRAQHQRAARERAGSGWADADRVAAHRTAAGQPRAEDVDARRRASRDHQPEQRNAQRRAQADAAARSVSDRLSELSRPEAPVRTSVHDTAASLRISVDPATLSTAGKADSARLGVHGEEGWTPVPVPVPTYTLKAEAPRRQVPPYQAPEPAEEQSAFGEVAPIEPGDAAEAERQAVLAEVEALRAAAGSPDAESAPAVPAAPASGGGPVAGAAPAAPAAPAGPAVPAAEQASAPHRQEPAMNLQAVLERRRAAGQ